MSHPSIPAKYRPQPQLVRGEWALCHRPPSPPVWRLAWWASHEHETIVSRKTGIAARMATPDYVVVTPWLEPQRTPEAAMMQLIDDQGLSQDTPMPQVEEAPGSLADIEDRTPSQRIRALMGYTS